MMLIANPIYDAVFKYLMEDTEIARRFISFLIGEEIVEIELKPQEHFSKSELFMLVVLRLDFKATIKTKDGQHKKVLIELQKGKHLQDIMRFRKYLAMNYRSEDLVRNVKGKLEEAVLPIITIYFLGFKLKKVPTAVLKVNRVYTDLIEQKEIQTKETFIEQLTHDCYVIQIPRLQTEERTTIEHLLKIFNQSYRYYEDERVLVLNEEEVKDNELLEMMANRLRRAATDEELLRKMEIVEEVENAFARQIRKTEDLKEQVEEQESILADQQSKLSEQQSKLSEQQSKLSEQQSKLSEQEELIEELKRKLTEKGIDPEP